jgi:hypothetical protein
MFRWLLRRVGDALAEGMAKRLAVEPALARLDHAARRLDDLYNLQNWQRHAQFVAFEDLLLARERERLGPKALLPANAQLFSQSYEDSMLAEIFARIGEGSRRFCEIGVEDGRENTSRLLLLRGWSGFWLEADEGFAASIRRDFSGPLADGRLELVQALVTAENIDALTMGLPAGERLAYLGIDIDQNTSHVWRASTLRPAVACIEYNAHFHPAVDWEIPYEPGRAWDHSNLYGASLKALERIGRDKGMSLVGCDLHGINAYFVADDLLGDHFAPPYTAEHHYQPPRFFPFVREYRGHPKAAP